MKNKHSKGFRQYTKCFVTAITVASMIWISISYVMGIYALMAYATTDLLSDLSKQICITLLGVSLGYFCKAYLETYSEKKNELNEKKIESDSEFDSEVATDDEVVG